VTKTSEIEVVKEPGLTGVIVHKDGDAVTDWFDPKIHPTVPLPPGNYKLESGFAPGRTVDHWEITNHGLFSGPMLMQFKRAPEFEVGRGEWVTIRAVLRDAPIGDVVPRVAPGPPDAAALRALRDQMASKERILETAKIKEQAGSYSRVEVVEAEIALTEARTRLAEAEENQERVCKLMEDLLTQLQDQRRLTAAKVEAGRELQEALNEVDARITEVKNHLDRARSKLPSPTPRNPD
jgi:hypothetical protein